MFAEYFDFDNVQGALAYGCELVQTPDFARDMGLIDDHWVDTTWVGAVQLESRSNPTDTWRIAMSIMANAWDDNGTTHLSQLCAIGGPEPPGPDDEYGIDAGFFVWPPPESLR